MILNRKLFIILGILFLSVASYAQPGGGGDPGGGEPVPFSGIEYLLLAGAALGIRKLKFFDRKTGNRIENVD